MPSVVDLYIFKNFSGFDGGEVESLITLSDMPIFLDIVLLSVFILKFRRKNDAVEYELKNKILRKAGIISIVISTLILLWVPVLSLVSDNMEETRKDMLETNDASLQARYLSSMGFHIVDGVDIFLESFDDTLSKEEQARIDEYYEWKNEGLKDNEYAGVFAGKNVLFLQVESLESFIINQTVDGQEICPNINKLLNNGFYFSNIFEQVQGGNSSDADLMFATSRLPVTKGSTFFRYGGEVEVVSLPRILIGDGYDFTYHQAIRGSFWNYEESWRVLIGADGFVGSESYDMSGDKIGFTMNDKDYLEQVIPYLNELKKPYYAHIVLNSSHMPFEIADELKELELPEELDDSYLGGYFQCVKYVDTRIGELLQALSESGTLDNTIIVVTGDHTGVHKYYEYSMEPFYDEYPFANVNGYYTVPLIISSSDYNKSVSSDVIAGQIDVMPTLAYLMGIPEEKYIYDAMGRNLLKTNRSYAIYRDGTIYGNLSDYEKELVKDSYNISEMMFQSGK
jgi:phosphoglycerol transferase MdoB-like AlkP superfamily enzyme